MDDLASLGIERYRGIVFLTGAGVSVASGLRPYRGPGGLWNEPDMARLNDAAALQQDPAAVWRLFGQMRRAAREAQPNAAHLAIAEAEKRLKADATFTVLTQNIDGLHQRAGSTNVVELHGSAFRTRCSSCEAPPFADDEPHAEGAPSCRACGAPLRPDVVLFGEPMPARAEWDAKRALRDCDLFIAVGTSGTVAPASSFVRWAEYERARTILVNLEPMVLANPAFDQQIIGRAEDILPRLLGRT